MNWKTNTSKFVIPCSVFIIFFLIFTFYYLVKVYLKKLTILNYKNILQKDIEFSANINCFVGDNGTGKTNLLDAIYYLSFTKSYFNHVDNQNITHGEEFFMLQGEYQKNSKPETIHCSFKRGKKKIIKYNQVKYKRFSDHIGIIPVVIITPDDNKLILADSKERRIFIDTIISQYNSEYLNNLIKYKRVLAQRNQLLKNFAERNNFSQQSLSIWDEQLVSLGNKIFAVRNSFITDFVPIFQKYYKYISNQTEFVSIKYKSQLKDTNFTKLLDMTLAKDRILQHTSVGIHKDDLIFTLQEYPLKKIGSQGQQKTFLLSLKFAQYELIKKFLKINPILLLDDLFDKLDATRIEQIVKLVADNNFGQIFITHTNIQRLENILLKINTEYKILNIFAT